MSRNEAPPTIYTLEMAAVKLGVDPYTLYRQCRQGWVKHADLGPGLGDDGIYRTHLIRFTDQMLTEYADTVARPGRHRRSPGGPRLVPEPRVPE